MRDLPEYMRVTQAFYDEVAELYAKNTAAMLDIAWLEKLSALLVHGAQILDVGCAAGRDAAWFAERGFQVTGIDVSTTFVAMAMRDVPLGRFLLGTVTSLEFPDGAFDAIWCSCVLIHLTKADATSAIQEMRRVLRPNGVAFFLVKAGDREGYEADPRYDGRQKYASYYTEHELREMLTEFEIEAFEVVDRPVDTYRAPDRIFIVARRLAEPTRSQ